MIITNETYDSEGRLVSTDEIEVPDPVPPRSTHVSTLVAIDTTVIRPARVKRTYMGIDFFYDCFVTENVKDQFLQGDVQVGDYVLVHYDDDEQVVTHKIFKSW